MTHYVDGFVHPIPKDKVDSYKELVVSVAQIWKEHGALEYWECAESNNQFEGLTSFRESIKATDDEVVMFGWMLFGSEESRDAAHQKVPADPRMEELMSATDVGFDASRMVYGVFHPIGSAPA